jgi:hypothetical protein
MKREATEAGYPLSRFGALGRSCAFIFSTGAPGDDGQDIQVRPIVDNAGDLGSQAMGAPSSRPPARPTVQAFVFSFCTPDDETVRGVRTLCVCASTLAGCIARTKVANGANGSNKRVLKNVIIDEPLEYQNHLPAIFTLRRCINVKTSSHHWRNALIRSFAS